MAERYKPITNKKSLKFNPFKAVLSLFQKPFKPTLSNKKALLPLLALFFSPIGIIILIILALLAFGLIGFGVFLTLNLVTIGGIILIIMGLIAFINGQINQITLITISLGVILLILPFIFNALGNITLAAVLG